METISNKKSNQSFFPAFLGTEMSHLPSNPFKSHSLTTNSQIDSTPGREEYQVQPQQRCMLDEQLPVDFPVSPNARVRRRGYRFSHVSASLKQELRAARSTNGLEINLERVLDFLNIQ